VKTRIITSLVGVPVMLALLLWPGTRLVPEGRPWFCFVALLMGMAIYEYTRELRAKGIYVHWAILTLLGAVELLDTDRPFVWVERVLGPILSLFHLQLFPDCAVIFVLVVLAGDLIWTRRSPLKNVGATFLGAGWIALTLPYLLTIVQAGAYYTMRRDSITAPLGLDLGAWLMLTVLLVIWAGDTGAYFVGRAVGRHKMAPEISPNKTWEGAAGGFAASWAIGAGMLWPLGLPPVLWLLFGPVVGIAGQIGDLVESGIKRELGIKDFGSIIPGHGGVLDRFDSLLFAAPTAHFLLTWLSGANFLR
jgi:phosphatidate cytidylyltransferase